MIEVSGQWYSNLDQYSDESVCISISSMIARNLIDDKAREGLQLVLELHRTYASVKIVLMQASKVIEELNWRNEIIRIAIRLNRMPQHGVRMSDLWSAHVMVQSKEARKRDQTIGTKNMDAYLQRLRGTSFGWLLRIIDHHDTDRR